MTAVLDELRAHRAGHLASTGCPRSAPQRSWPRPATRPGSPPPGRWSSTPAWHRGRSSPAPSPAGPSSPARADPKLRLAAWRAVWGALQTNTVYAARYRHLTTREPNKLTPTQAQTVIAAAILRHLHAVITTGQAWDPVIATHGTTAQGGRSRSPPDSSGGGTQADGRGEPYAALRTTSTSPLIMGSPVRRLLNPITRCRAQPDSPLCRDRRRTRHRPDA